MKNGELDRVLFTEKKTETSKVIIIWLRGLFNANKIVSGLFESKAL